MLVKEFELHIPDGSAERLHTPETGESFLPRTPFDNEALFVHQAHPTLGFYACIDLFISNHRDASVLAPPVPPAATNALQFGRLYAKVGLT